MPLEEGLARTYRSFAQVLYLDAKGLVLYHMIFLLKTSISVKFTLYLYQSC